MNSTRSSLSLSALATEIPKLDFHLDGSGAEMAFRPSHGIPVWLSNGHFPTIAAAISEIAALRGLPPVNLMVNRLAPGVDVPVHRDWLLPTPMQLHKPTVERWHLPISTNPDAQFWERGVGYTHMPLGVWGGPVRYWNYHSVRNFGTTERVHLVVDLDSPVRMGEYEEDFQPRT